MADVTDRQHEQSIEDLIVSKHLEAPRIKPYDLDAAIDPATPPQYHVFPGTTTTVCLLTLKNGYTVTGESAAASPENFDEDVGREVAFKDARNKLWPLLGFLLKDSLAKDVANSHESITV
jgi:hypothetical protein